MPSIHKLRPPWLRVIGHRKEKFEKYRWHGRAFLAGLFITGCLLAWSTGFLQEEEYVIDAFKSSRHLLSSAAFLGNDYTLQNCSEISEAANHTAVEWETCDYELVHLKELWVIFYFVCILIVFVALAIICDDFFVPSLEAISEKLHLSEDVAGATFMAAGSSAPELFTSVAGVSYETDVGIGTIVGSAVFNILVIIALTAALSGQVLHLDWRPMTRDSIFYALSIACFIQFSWDGVLELYEAIILLVLYILYIFIMVINVRLMDWMATWKTGCKKVKVEPTEDGEDGQELERKKSLKNITLTDTGTKANGVIEKQFIDVNDHNVTEVSMSGGHARRLSIISHRSSTADVANADKHIFHHTRQGSISGSFTGAGTPPHSPPGTPGLSPFQQFNKDSGFQSTEPSYIPSNDTSRTDLHDSPIYNDYINEDFLRPPHVFRKRTGSSYSSGDEKRGSVDFRYPPKDKFMADVHKVTTIEDTLELMKQINKVRNSLDSTSSLENVRYQQGNTNSSNTSHPGSGKSLLGTANSGFQDSELQINAAGNQRRKPLPPLNRADTHTSLDCMNLPNIPALPPITTEPPPSKPSLPITNTTGESSDTLSDHTVLAPSVSHHGTASDHSEKQALPSNSLTESLHAYQPHEGAIAEEEDSEGSCKNGDGKNHVVEEEEEVERTMKICPCACCIELRGAPPSNEEAAAKGKYCSKAGFGPWSIYILKYILFVVSFPFICLFTWTVPDCSKPHNRKCFLLSFIMSVLWIVILSFALVTVVGRTGCILGIDTYTMGLVVVAIGTSVPDALSSVLVARDGYGDMAVSNAIGSNVFDINLGLGLPFLIRIAIKGPVNLISERKACFMSQNPLMMVPHAKFGFLLLLILGFVQIAFGITRFKLRKQIGIAFVILYGVFLCYAFVQEIHCAQIFC
ncbi:sodium/potassium/calcium exchanger 1-like isoform X2 [Lineus longissimus]|uniref:sodium/potassium/calcium exchanger 1-like isoform X2 n=1 Tax=Lineus longissimus TaxID=88925 RepID=UPI00315C674D